MYDKATADISSKVEPYSVSKLSNEFYSIQNVDITQLAEQNQIQPRMVRTGTTRGDQQIKGKYTVADENNTIRVEIGYHKGAF